MDDLFLSLMVTFFYFIGCAFVFIAAIGAAEVADYKHPLRAGFVSVFCVVFIAAAITLAVR